MDWRLLVAAVLTIALAALHSVLGERRVLRPVLARAELAAGLRRTVRLAWHLTSLYFAGCGAVLVALAGRPPGLSALYVLVVLAAVFAASAAITCGASRGRHPGWPLFAGAALLVGWTAARHDGGVPVAVALPIFGLVAAAVLAAVALLHAWWAAGGATGIGGAVPERAGAPVFHPSRWATALVALALAAAAAVLAARALDLLDGVPAQLATVACWALAAVFLARTVGDFRYAGLFKRVHGTAFAFGDTALYTPLCLLLALAAAATA